MNRLFAPALVLLLSLVAGGCEIVTGLIEFGFWVGVILVVLVILLIWWIYNMVS